MLDNKLLEEISASLAVQIPIQIMKGLHEAGYYSDEEYKNRLLDVWKNYSNIMKEDN